MRYLGSIFGSGGHPGRFLDPICDQRAQKSNKKTKNEAQMGPMLGSFGGQRDPREPQRAQKSSQEGPKRVQEAPWDTIL